MPQHCTASKCAFAIRMSDRVHVPGGAQRGQQLRNFKTETRECKYVSIVLPADDAIC